jgi:hypothetical protein
LVPSPPPTEMEDSTPSTIHQRALQWALSQSAPPSTRWLRPSGQTAILAPSMTQSPSALHSFYNDN